ncbi:lysophospholipid acyltransferase family protein [Candidatus Pelagibacter sp.]|jgi:1-acyl-sn-glycerol-3-phosphate acyltransferase|nr:1-acyl-sn-glycerol-3-phosphate acyltransferase [Candidatus Pelagibacter sp.]MDC1139487.1 lysophospholipid acyltransferase family protein [Candidatus Pelagibacter sp.]|tara:strand:- start:290 stop:991 length:702 start_codon:yes stop_codon:yes gene_type:complete
MTRNFLFSLFFFTGIIFISLIFLPAFFLPKTMVLFGGKIMGYWTSFCLQFFLSTKIIIKGKENIIEDKKFFIASSHQSMFETFFLQTIFNSPVFILKKELLMIPIFGWYLKKIDSISIKRNKISKENLGFFNDISRHINSSNRPLIIFPQGTRLPPEDRTPFKKGSSRIYEELKISCQPIAINSGNTWPKKGLKKINTILTISILKPIEPGLKKEFFLKKLENVIYSELDILN